MQGLEQVIQVLSMGGVCVVPTDTVYGITACARNKDAVERVYHCKRRSSTKPCIVLIDKLEQLAGFGVILNSYQRGVCDTMWPGPVTLVLSVLREGETLDWLHRGSLSIGFRLTADPVIQSIVAEVRPIIAPSANPQGSPPATTAEDARRYFGNSVDYYVDGGVCDTKPSTVISLESASCTVLRE
ncbi:MAG: L-threonylcarbamoyladenylate synthase [Candidatus Paceibacterota bacterium]